MVVGFHQARRPRQTAAARLRRELSWPRPGGVLLTFAGATLVFTGALAVAPSTTGEGPSGAAVVAPVTASAPSSAPPSTTPNTGQAASPSAAVAESGDATSPAAAPATLSASGSSASALPSATTEPAAVAVAGAAAGAPIQKLFAAKDLPPAATELRSIFNPASPLVLANKRNPLAPADYSPRDLRTPQVLSGSGEPVLLRAEAAAAAEQMFASAAAAGVRINVKSSYRSYETQRGLYNGYVASKGQAAADSTSARPGFSEHQTGLALDIGDANAGTSCDFNSCFANTAAAQWVAAHGADYGFIVRYVPGEESVTGYLAEPWHLRWVGIDVATDMRAHGIHSYEKYLGLPEAPGYK